MNAKDLINAVADDNSNPLNKTAAKLVLDLVFGKIAEALTGGDKVEIPGLGKFEVKQRAGRLGRNPKTGEALQIAASKNVGFKAAKSLKTAL